LPREVAKITSADGTESLYHYENGMLLSIIRDGKETTFEHTGRDLTRAALPLLDPEIGRQSSTK